MEKGRAVILLTYIFRLRGRAETRCGGPEVGKMVQCPTCEEWFHFKCVFGKDGEGPKEDEDYKCGGCKDQPLDEERPQKWQPEVSAFTWAGTKCSRAVSERRPGLTPKKRPKEQPANGGGVEGGGGWAGMKRKVRNTASAIMERRELRKRKTQSVVDKGGHHLSDTVGPEGVRPARVTDVVIDFVPGATGMDDDDN